MKSRICKYVIIIAFVLLYGLVGGIENYQISLAAGAAACFGCLAVAGIAAYIGCVR